jgi:uncharacterized SAM-binding protein YcdF (DUF218 family)
MPTPPILDTSRRRHRPFRSVALSRRHTVRGYHHGMRMRSFRPSRLVLPTLLVPAGLIGTLLAVGEFVQWRASRSELGEDPRRTSADADEVILVLGYRNAKDRANFVNRYRVRAGIRSIDSEARSSVLIFCGGAVGSDVPEAQILARYARDDLGFRGQILLEEESRSTRENVENAIPMIEDALGPVIDMGAGTIKIVSNSIHAEKAREYLREIRPDLAAHLGRGEDYRFGEITVIKALIALGARRMIRNFRRQRSGR